MNGASGPGPAMRISRMDASGQVASSVNDACTLAFSWTVVERLAPMRILMSPGVPLLMSTSTSKIGVNVDEMAGWISNACPAAPADCSIASRHARALSLKPPPCCGLACVAVLAVWLPGGAGVGGVGGVGGSASVRRPPARPAASCTAAAVVNPSVYDRSSVE